MKDNRIPDWFKFNPAKVGAEVEGLGIKEQGAYFILMRVIWQRGPIPESDVVRLCRGAHEDIIPTMVDVEGLKSFAWLEEARSFAASALQKASEAGRASAAARAAKPQRTSSKRSTPVQRPFNEPSTPVELPLNISSTTVEQPLNGSSTGVLSNLISSPLVSSPSPLGRGAGETDSEESDATYVEPEIWPSFSDFWEAYDKKRERPLCEAAWAKMPQEDREAAMRAIPDYIASTPDKTYRKDPIRFLKHKGWENEIIRPTSASSAAGSGLDQKGREAHDLIARKYAGAGGYDSAGY